MSPAAEMLREKAHDYQLTAEAAKERGETDAALHWTGIALTLNEVANALDLEAAA